MPPRLLRGDMVGLRIGAALIMAFVSAGPTLAAPDDAAEPVATAGCAGPAVAQGVAAVEPAPAAGPVLWPSLALAPAGDGRRGPSGVMLAGVVLPASVGLAAATALRARLGRLAGATVTVYGASPRLDRRGRATGQVVATGGAAPGWLQRDLVAAGLVMVDGTGGACAAALSAAEREAEVARRGVWAGAGPTVAADGFDAAALPDFVLLDGRVDTVGETGATTYLNFGRSFARDASVRVDRRTSAAMVVEGTLNDLAGRRVRARGWAEPIDGLDIRLAAPEALEIIGE